jgi:aldehyde dehydrogenase (NAD+)
MLQIIFKSSEKSPLGVLALGPLFVEAGFPPGVVQFISGGPKTGALLASHMQIGKVSFTGSVATGRKVQEAAARSNLKLVTLELGGKSPAIVFDDADIDVALGASSAGFLFNSGQICAASSRLYVHEEIAPKFIEALKERFENSGDMMGGDPLERTTGLGPLVDRVQLERVQGYIEKGKTSATLLTGGAKKGEKGCFVLPTIFLDPQDDSPVYKEEIFGPVLVVKTFKTETEVVDLANDTTYGLVGQLFGPYYLSFP